MTVDNARLLVIGAGVNGSVCATGLYNAGFDVTVLARGKRVEEIRNEGIVIEDQFKNTRSVTRIPVIGSLEPDDCYDYILVVVRKNQVPDLLPILARNSSPNVVFMVNNGLGSDEWTRIINRDRVMMGFVFAAGKREGNVIRAIIPKARWLTTPFGEIDGTITSRLVRLVAIWHRAGFNAERSTEVTDWLATHASLVALFAAVTIKHGCDLRALARSTSDLTLLVDAMRETLDVLRCVGHRIVPRSNAILGIVPRFISVMALRVLLPTKVAEIGGAWHVSKAGDEMQQLINDLEALVEKSRLPAPAIRKLFGQEHLALIRLNI